MEDKQLVGGMGLVKITREDGSGETVYARCDRFNVNHRRQGREVTIMMRSAQVIEMKPIGDGHYGPVQV